MKMLLNVSHSVLVQLNITLTTKLNLVLPLILIGNCINMFFNH